MKTFCVAMGHESNVFSPIPTSLDSFREDLLCLPSKNEGMELIERFANDDNVGSFARKKGHDVIPGLIAFAQPSLPMVQRDFEILRDEILSNLRAAMPVDTVIMFLHGAQMAYGYDDCEGEILKQVRAIVGPDVPVGVEIDLHGNITPAMIENCDALIACKEYPHIDFGPRAAELVDIIDAAAKGRCRPTMAHARVPMIGSFFTTREPMRSFVDEISSMEGKDGVLSISLGHGFAWSDFEDAGAGVVVVTDNDKAKAQSLADELAQRFFSMRESLIAPVISIDEALDIAEHCSDSAKGPVVLAEYTDNPGGGAAGDSTFLLRAMIERGAENAAAAMIWDPVAVRLIQSAGEGARLPLRIGGKIGPCSGAPIDVEASVLKINNTATQKGETPADPLGPAAAIEANGVQIVLNSIRQQTYGPECFTQFGIEPASKNIIAVKSHQHFHARFSPIARDILYVSTPGTVSDKFNEIPFKRLKRPTWPLDNVPITAFGRAWG